MLRFLLLLLGIISLIVGIIGIFLPVLPTVPFLLLTAYCFSKGSPRMHAWLLAQPHIGPPILDWQKHGVIRKEAKIGALLALLGLLATSQWYGWTFHAERMSSVPIWVWILVAAVFVSVLSFILSRPSSPRA